MTLKSLPIEDQKRFIHEAAHAVVALELSVGLKYVQVSLVEEQNENPDANSCETYLSGNLKENTQENFLQFFHSAVVSTFGYYYESKFTGTDLYFLPIDKKLEGNRDQNNLLLRLDNCASFPLDIIQKAIPIIKESHKDTLGFGSVIYIYIQSECKRLSTDEKIQNKIITLAEELTTRVKMSGEEVKALLTD